MNSKKGITLIILIITIVLVLILIATTAATAGSAIDNSRITSLANDLKELEDATQIYYMKNDTLPILEEEGKGMLAYSKADIITKVDKKYMANFEEELNLNGDNPTVNEELGTFYKLDLAKLDVEQTTRGLHKDPNDNDFYVISYPSLHIYYVRGVNAKKSMYFSLSSRITTLVRITDPSASTSKFRMASTVVDTVAGITTRKYDKTWTNQLDLSIETYVEKGEELYLRLKDGTKHRLMTIDGQNVFYLGDTLKEIYSNTTKEKYATGVTDTEINTFEALSQKDKYLLIQKERSGALIGERKVDLQNYETKSPIAKNNLTDKVITSKEDNNHVSFYAEDSISGIKEVRYEYKQKITESGEYDDYYDGVSTYEVAYMKTRAKKANVSTDGLVEMDIPKDISGVEVRIFDKAGNVSDVITINPQSGVYSVATAKKLTKTDASFQLLFNTKTRQDILKATIDSVVTEISTDGVHYGNARTLTLSDISDTIKTAVVDYAGFSNISTLYLKTTVKYNGNSKTEVRIQPFNLPDDVIPSSVKLTFDYNVLYENYWVMADILNNNNYVKNDTATIEIDRPSFVVDQNAILAAALKIHITKTGGNGGFLYLPQTPLVLGRTYTWSLAIKANRNMSLQIGPEQGGVIHVDVGTEYQKIKHTFVAQNVNGYSNFVFYTNTTYNLNDDVYIHSFQLQEGNAVNSEMIDYRTTGNQMRTLPVPPTNPWNVSFEGWYTQPSGGVRVVNSTLVPSKDTTYYARWRYPTI